MIEKIEYIIKKGYTIDKCGIVTSHIGNVRKCKPDSGGYMSFTVRCDGKCVTIRVHKFQAYIKYGDKISKRGNVVRHLDGDKSNNSWDNIAIGTQSDNMNDRPISDRLNHAVTSSSMSRRFDDKTVKQIRRDHQNGMSYNQLCVKYETSKSTLSYLFNNKYVTIK